VVSDRGGSIFIVTQNLLRYSGKFEKVKRDFFRLRKMPPRLRTASGTLGFRS